MSSAKALVTGSEGFLGKHLVPFLQAKDIDVMCVDMNTHMFYDNAEEVFSDCKMQFDYVFHLAAHVGGRTAIDGLPLVVAKNVILDTLLWQWVAKTAPKNVCYLSSSAVYPVSMQTREYVLKESDQPEQLFQRYRYGIPDKTYGWAKLNGEFLSAFIDRRKTTVQIVRPFTGYGPGQSFDYPVPSIAKRVALHEYPVQVWGPTQYRDFVHVDDFIRALWLVTTNGDGEPYNISSGEGHTFDEVAELMIASEGFKTRPQIVHLADAPTGVLYRVGDNTRIRHLGWEPEFSFASGILNAYNHVKQFQLEVA